MSSEYHTAPKEAACFFLTQKIRPLLSGVIIQLKINTNVAALLSKWTASLPPSLYVAGKTQCCLCCQDSTETLVEFFFSCGGVETLVGLCIVSFSFLHQAVSAKGENCVLSDQQLF